MTAKTMEELVSLCKRRGFLFQSNDIYGGIKGLYDYGPMGVEFKNNLKQAWWKSMVYERDDTEGLDASILSSPVVLKLLENLKLRHPNLRYHLVHIPLISTKLV